MKESNPGPVYSVQHVDMKLLLEVAEIATEACSELLYKHDATIGRVHRSGRAAAESLEQDLRKAREAFRFMHERLNISHEMQSAVSQLQ